jgi:hypothetical protein
LAVLVCLGAVDFKELLRMEPDGGVTNIRNVSRAHWKRWLGTDNRCLVPFSSFSEYHTIGGKKVPVWFAADDKPAVVVFQKGAGSMKTAIAYTRVSTAQQGKSGLGLRRSRRPWRGLSRPRVSTWSRHSRRSKQRRGQPREEAPGRAEELRPVLTELAGMSARKIAAALNERKVATPTGGDWHAATVIRVQKRLGLG